MATYDYNPSTEDGDVTQIETTTSVTPTDPDVP